MKAIRVKEEWERAGVYYVRTEAMVFGFDLSLQGEFSDDDRNSEYILVVDDKGKPLSTNRKIVITSREEVKGFYEKLGYTARYDMSPDTLEKKVEGEEKPVKDPRFICVYMEKVVDTPGTV